MGDRVFSEDDSEIMKYIRDDRIKTYVITTLLR